MMFHGVSRLDASGHGIHLLWSWPRALPLSDGGYDIQRMEWKEGRGEERCEVIDRLIMGVLATRREFPAPLGPLRMCSGVGLGNVADQTLASPSGMPGDDPLGSQGELTAVATRSAPALATMSSLTTGEVGFTEFVQELRHPAERARVEVVGRAALAIALSGGKSVAASVGQGSPISMVLEAPAIDTIAVYVLVPELVEICVVEVGSDPAGADAIWQSAPYIIKGLTLPIHEADPTLASAAAEFAAATSRLVGGESLARADFERLVRTLRPPVSAHLLGRSGARTVLVRSDPEQSYEELSLDSQLSALAVHPKIRRVLGFGFADHHGLVAGRTYVYRLTGRFDAADLTDTIYDVHDVAAATVLPAAFSIRDLAFRFQAPVKVVLDPAPSAKALHAASRRGIRIDTSDYDSSYAVPLLDSWSAIITLPRPVQDVILEVEDPNTLAYAGGQPWGFGSLPPTPMPAGRTVKLTFPSPVMELRLVGVGTLYAVRIPSGQTGRVEVHAVTPPIRFAAEPLPDPPTVFTAYNLQQPLATLTGPIDESTPVQERPIAGFQLNWVPATASGLNVWPDDIDTGPPLDAIAYQIDHREVRLPATYGYWEPIGPDDNLTVGSRDSVAPDHHLEYGCDLTTLFPSVRQRPATGGFVLHLSDVFGVRTDPTSDSLRPAPPLGTCHQYQIRAMDAVGRVSATTTLSNVARLEKHIPPPLPTGPQPPPDLDADGHLTAPPGPRARAIVKGAPGLTASDIALLGAHGNVVLLEWGWRQVERELDPTTSEFRVYTASPLDVVEATIIAVASAGPHWHLSLTTDKALVADELAGQWISSGGYPYRVAHNDAGTTPSVLVEVATLQAARQPVTGAVTFGRPLRPEHQRPAGWEQRVAVYPLTAADNYSHPIYDALTLSDTHPRDSLWIGVSAADAQPYVGDERTAGANANRPGNESGIVTCAVVARYRGQPTFSVPPPLGDVPELVTDEPTGRQVLVALDIAALLGGALAAGAPIVVERCTADTVMSRTSVNAGNVLVTHPDGTEDVIAFPNPGDDATVLATLNSDHPERLANRYLLHLVAASSAPASFFTRMSADIVQVATVTDRLAPKPGRVLYFVRAADAAGHVSDGGALLPVVVRVPSTAAAVPPQRRSLVTTDTSVTLTVALGDDPDTTTALLFAVFAPPGSPLPGQGEAELLRIPNRRDLYPNDGIRLRLSDATLVAPKVVKGLSDVDVVVEPDGTRVAALTVAAARGTWATLWCYGLTRDGIPSFVCGPFGSGVEA